MSWGYEATRARATRARAIQAREEYKRFINTITSTRGEDMGRLLASKCEVYSAVEDLVSVETTEHIHLGRAGTRVKNAVKIALRTGVMNSYGGLGAFLYRVICNRHGIPMCFCTRNEVVLGRSYSNDLVGLVTAAHLLTGGQKPRCERSLYLSKITCHQLRKFIAEEYATYNEHTILAIQEIDNGAVYTNHVTITE